MKLIDYWKDLSGYEGLYQISFSGNIISYDIPTKNRDGSYRVRKGKLLTKWKMFYLLEAIF